MASINKPECKRRRESGTGAVSLASAPPRAFTDTLCLYGRSPLLENRHWAIQPAREGQPPFELHGCFRVDLRRVEETWLGGVIAEVPPHGPVDELIVGEFTAPFSGIDRDGAVG